MKRLTFTLLFLLPAAAAYAVVEGDIVAISSDAVVDPGLPFHYSVAYERFTGDPMAVIIIELPSGFIFSSGDSCRADSSRVVCPTEVGFHSFTMTAIAPDVLEGGAFVTTATLTHASTRTTVSKIARTFVVDATGDDGAGSLRAAIENANARCTDAFPCKVAFRIGTASQPGYRTISPASALPAITTDSLSIDGTTQTRTIGDTNPDGPEVFIDGSRVPAGNGFTFAGCTDGVSGLAIGNFPNAALRLLNAGCGVATIANNNIGVDPTGLRAAPNERGIVVDQRSVAIQNNLISANRRSGIFLVDRPSASLFDQNGGSTIIGNTIGLDRRLQPLGNGASGVYVDGSAVVRANYIAFNHEAGISIDHTTDKVDVEVNSIFANWQIGIDVGIDGPSFSFRPAILSARYDAASDRTVIDMISIATPGNLTPVYRFYASDAPHPSGFGDGQYFLGETSFVPGEQIFTFRAIGDWRGKWVSATQTNRYLVPGKLPFAQTSEFGRTVEVQ